MEIVIFSIEVFNGLKIAPMTLEWEMATLYSLVAFVENLHNSDPKSHKRDK
jgi:hypothetical protein